MGEKRTKRVSYGAGDEVHEYAFTTYRRQPFLEDDEFKRFFLRNLDRARTKDRVFRALCPYICLTWLTKPFRHDEEIEEPLCAFANLGGFA